MSNPNHRLRQVMVAASLTTQRLAELAEVDAKSVERWVTQGRVPRSVTRSRVAKALGHDETYLWPSLLGDQRSIGVTQAELQRVWPTRDSVPGDVWTSMVTGARSRVDVLVYSGGFLVEVFRMVDVLRELSSAGGRARFLLGDSTSEAVRQRGVDEGLPTLPARAASTLEYLAPVLGLPGVEVRTQSAPLYVSLYRFDDAMLANLHTHGAPAKDSPVLQIQRIPGGHLFAYYEAAFDRVWERSTPV